MALTCRSHIPPQPPAEEAKVTSQEAAGSNQKERCPEIWITLCHWPPNSFPPRIWPASDKSAGHTNDPREPGRKMKPNCYFIKGHTWYKIRNCLIKASACDFPAPNTENEQTPGDDNHQIHWPLGIPLTIFLSTQTGIPVRYKV